MTEFFERNSNKPFFTNLKKYSELTDAGKTKCILSLFVHIVIDSENCIDNMNIQEELLAILNKIILFKKDDFIMWLKSKLEE
jgi:hypothetical protein